MQDTPRGGAVARSVSLYPAHYAVLDRAAEHFGARPHEFSRIVQAIIEDWARIHAEKFQPEAA